jgi:hypothetical protein
MPAVACTARALTAAVPTARASRPALQRQCARIAAGQSANKVLTRARNAGESAAADAQISPDLVCLFDAEQRCARHVELRDGRVQGARCIGR